METDKTVKTSPTFCYVIGVVIGVHALLVFGFVLAPNPFSATDFSFVLARLDSILWTGFSLLAFLRIANIVHNSIRTTNAWQCDDVQLGIGLGLLLLAVGLGVLAVVAHTRIDLIRLLAA